MNCRQVYTANAATLHFSFMGYCLLFITNKHSNFPSSFALFYFPSPFQSEVLKKQRKNPINGEGTILIDAKKKLLSENLPLYFQVTISFSTHL